MSDGDRTWELTPKAQDDLAALDSHEQDRILDKLDEIVNSRRHLTNFGFDEQLEGSIESVAHVATMCYPSSVGLSESRSTSIPS